MDEAAVAGLYRCYAPLVHARASRILACEADDVVQDAFERFLRKRPDEQNLTAWFYATATNLCLDRLRRHRRRDPAWQREVARAGGDGVDGASELRLLNADLVRALLGHLDALTQRIVVLVYFDEMTQDEAAGTLGLSRKTVNERLQRFYVRARKVVSRWS